MLSSGGKYSGEKMRYSDYVFDFEKLNVYKKALAFANQVFTITLNFRKEIQYSLGDQFRRAVLSICNNVAEGSRKSGKARKQYYDYALDSARECIPMITLCVLQGQIDAQKEASLRDECVQICNMLYKLGLSLRPSPLTLNT